MVKHQRLDGNGCQKAADNEQQNRMGKDSLQVWSNLAVRIATGRARHLLAGSSENGLKQH